MLEVVRCDLDAQALEEAVDQAIEACGGDAREAVKALLVANEFLENEFRLKFHTDTRAV